MLRILLNFLQFNGGVGIQITDNNYHKSFVDIM